MARKITETRTEISNVEPATNTRNTAQNIVWYVVGLVEALLALRFVFKLLGANADSGFVNFIYAITNPLTAPFNYIFHVATNNSGNVHSVFEPSILVAMLVYALIGWAIARLLVIDRN